MNFFNNIRETLGNLFVGAGARIGASPFFIPNIRSFWSQIEKDFGMHYDAASTSRVRNDWAFTSGSPYWNIKSDLQKLIARSRNSSDNNGLSANIDKTFMANVVGPVGIKPQPMVRDERGELMENVNQTLAEGWKRYNDQWDRTGKSTYYENQKLGLNTIINSGSILRNTVPSKRNDFLPIANQMIEPDRLNWTMDMARPMAANIDPIKQTQFGIELDEYGVALRFHVKGIEKPIPAKNMDIRYIRRRTEQYIGVPWKSPILKYLWDADNLIEDKAVASRIQAMIALWVHEQDAPGLLKNKDASNRKKWEPARLFYSKYEPKVIESKTSISETFDPLMRLIQRTIGVGVGLSYQSLTKDLQGMNFASSRANILEDRRIYRMFQSWFIKEFCHRDWKVFVFWMFASGKMAPLSLTDYNRDQWKYQEAHWQAPGWDWVDPLKDAKAAVELRQNGMQSLQEYYGSRGMNWREEINQIAQELVYMKQLEDENQIEFPKGEKAEAVAISDLIREIDDGSNA